jgi:hypothetical protein
LTLGGQIYKKKIKHKTLAISISTGFTEGCAKKPSLPRATSRLEKLTNLYTI